MKNHFAIAFFFVCMSLQAQLEFAPIGAKWTYQLINTTWWGDTYFSHRELFVEKDSLIQNKLCKKLKVNYYSKLTNGTLLTETNPDEFIYQNGGKIYRLIQDSFYLLYDFDLHLGESVELTGIVMEELINANQKRLVGFEVLESEIDNSYNFIQRKLKMKAVCFLTAGTPILYERFGMVNEYFFFAGFHCVTDRNSQFKLRCYDDPKYGLFNFDSIPCDSIRPNIIRTSIKDPSEFASVQLQSTVVNQNLSFSSTNFENSTITYLILNSTGQIIHANKINAQAHSIDVSDLSTGLYFLQVQSENSTSQMLKFIKI